MPLWIFYGYHPSLLGNIPAVDNLDFEGSKMASSLPVIKASPLSWRANARLCIALPPIAMK